MVFKNGFEVLVERVQALKVFQRNKKPVKLKVLSTLLYYAGLSYRVAAGFASVETPVSYEAVRLWRKRLREAAPKLKLKRRRVVAVDETKLKLIGEQFYLWAAVDVDTHEVLAFKASWQRSSLDALIFMEEVLKLCSNKPLILVDKGPWYPWAFIQLGLKFRHMTFGLRNTVEQWFSHLKARTKRFYNNFPHGSSLKSVQTYLAIHTATYNLLLGLT